MGLEWTPGEYARHARAELEAIAASLRGTELAELLVLARAIVNRSACTGSPPAPEVAMFAVKGESAAR